MRLVVQRASRAAVRVAHRTVAETGPGLMVLVGVARGDGDREAEWLAEKVFHLRIFEDAEGKMNLSMPDVGGEVLVVPNFTLYGDARRGRRPSWAAAAPPDVAERLVEQFASALEGLGASVKRGAFQQHMQVEVVNDGPVTIVLDSSG